jgi:hypothetical protein
LSIIQGPVCCRAVPNPNITVRNFFIAVPCAPAATAASAAPPRRGTWSRPRRRPPRHPAWHAQHRMPAVRDKGRDGPEVTVFFAFLRGLVCETDARRITAAMVRSTAPALPIPTPTVREVREREPKQLPAGALTGSPPPPHRRTAPRRTRRARPRPRSRRAAQQRAATSPSELPASPSELVASTPRARSVNPASSQRHPASSQRHPASS